VLNWDCMGRMMESKLKMQTADGPVVGSVFRTSAVTLLGEFFKRRATVNSERYVKMLRKLKQQIRRIRPKRTMNIVIILPTVPI